MIRATRISGYAHRGAEGAGAAWRSIHAQPSWIVRAAAIVFVVVVGLPVLVLFVLALLLAFVVFAVLVAINVAVGVFRGTLPRDDGRENVRVIRRE